MDTEVTHQRPCLGFNLVSWNTSTHMKHDHWFEALERIEALGVRRITIVCYRFLQPDSGIITENSTYGLATGPSEAVIATVAERAHAHKLDVGISPFVEVDNPNSIGRPWRGSVSFNRECLVTFFAAYEKYIGEITTIARRGGANRLYIGSELASLTGDPRAASYWMQLITNTRQTLGHSCRLGYAANHDEFVQVPFWSDLDDIGVDAYLPLASTWEAKGRSRPREDVLMRGFDRNLRKLKKFSDKHKKRLTISEWGTVPFDLTSVRPWHWQPSQTPDADEQVRTYKTLLQSIGNQGSWLSACDLWHWRMPGNEGSSYGIDHSSQVAKYIRRYVTPED